MGYFEELTDMHICRENGRVDYQLIYVKRGALNVYDGEDRHLLGEGTVCLFRPRERQKYGIDKEPTTFFWIHFSGREAERMLSFFEKRAYFVGDLPEFERYCRGFSEEFGSEAQYAELLYEGELIALIARMAERIRIDTDKRTELLKLKIAIDAMRLRPEERKTNAELAEMCKLSKSYFIKLFKSVTGDSPQQYYARVSVDRGRSLLSSTSYNISEIAALCGMDDSLYFSRFFKKHTGFSPTAYRKKCSADPI